MKRASQSAQAVATLTANATRRVTTIVTKPLCILCKKKQVHAREHCNVCYTRLKRRGVEMPKTPRMSDLICKFEDCNRAARTQFYCVNHHLWMARHKPEEIGLDPAKCMRRSCPHPRKTSGLCADHYKKQIEQNSRTRAKKRLNREPSEPRRKALRPNYADPANIKHLVEGKKAPDDFWEFVQYELGIKK